MKPLYDPEAARNRAHIGYLEQDIARLPEGPAKERKRAQLQKAREWRDYLARRNGPQEVAS